MYDSRSRPTEVETAWMTESRRTDLRALGFVTADQLHFDEYEHDREGDR